jgi:DNA-binding MltR family transcriptional regulator
MPPRRDREKIEEQLRDSQGLIEEMQAGPDRSAVIIGAAFLDERLRQYIERFLVNDATALKDILGVNRPLGTFGARIQIAYCLGLLTVDEYRDFKIVQEIRNAFAHQLHGISFSDPWVTAKCRDFAIPKAELSEQLYLSYTPRELFLFIVVDLNSVIATQRFSLLASDERRVVPKARSWRQHKG